MTNQRLASESAQDACTVHEITLMLKQVLEGEFREVWVTGEISNFKRAASGHLYFTLKDDKAQLSAVMFKYQAARFNSLDLKQGVKVRIFGNITIYEKAGQYQLLCKHIEKVGFGDLQLKFLQLKEDLHQKGWFEPDRKKPLPFIPQRIGIVTSRTGAVIRDMLNIIYSRYPNMQVLLYPAKVQGEGAAASIKEGIQYLNTEAAGVDVMIIGRGGGSIEDLWAFNEKVVAEAIFNSRIPVISAVGHEVDFTISDFVADFRAETPSAAAHRVVPLKTDLLEHFSEQGKQLGDILNSRVTILRSRIESLKTHYAFKEPRHQVYQWEQRIDELRQGMQQAFKNQVQRLRDKRQGLCAQVESLSPFAVLDRGFAILQDQRGRLVRSVNDTEVQEELSVVLHDGQLGVQVKSRKAGGEPGATPTS